MCFTECGMRISRLLPRVSLVTMGMLRRSTSSPGRPQMTDGEVGFMTILFVERPVASEAIWVVSGVLRAEVSGIVYISPLQIMGCERGWISGFDLVFDAVFGVLRRFWFRILRCCRQKQTP